VFHQGSSLLALSRLLPVRPTFDSAYIDGDHSRWALRSTRALSGHC
jgi:hypothetical protein